MADNAKFGQVSAGDLVEHTLSAMAGAPGSSAGIVKFKALTTNTGVIYLSHTVATAANGYPLGPGQEVEIDMINPGKLHMIQTVAGDRLAWHTLSA